MAMALYFTLPLMRIRATEQTEFTAKYLLQPPEYTFKNFHNKYPLKYSLFLYYMHLLSDKQAFYRSFLKLIGRSPKESNEIKIRLKKDYRTD